MKSSQPIRGGQNTGGSFTLSEITPLYIYYAAFFGLKGYEEGKVVTGMADGKKYLISKVQYVEEGNGCSHVSVAIEEAK